MNPIQVSVISTVYNGEEYFDRALPSILSQVHQSFEYIVVDDGSTDHTLELLLRVAKRDSRLKVLAPGRLGRTAALRLAVETAGGDYIANQDFDDVSYPNRLTLQANFLSENPSVGVVGCHYVIIDENRGERYVRRPPRTHHELVRAMARSIPLAHTTVMFRKKAWMDCGGYPDVEDIEDLRLWVEFAKRGWKLAALPQVLGEHYVHAESYWHRTYSYRRRQAELRRVQHSAVRELDLPRWMHLYPLGRQVYAWLPTDLKRVARRWIGRSKEVDLT